MTRFIILTFLFMGWGFYELSGGSDFDPVATRNARLEPEVTIVQKPISDPVPEVTRVSLNLVSVDKVLAPTISPAPKPAQAALTQAVAKIESSAAPELETPSIILPSLVSNGVTVRPVDFGQQATNETAAQDIRSVTGNRVNLRGGPGTGYGVISSLSKGDEVEVLDDPGNGWVRLRPVDGGPMGWMADFLLTEG